MAATEPSGQHHNSYGYATRARQYLPNCSTICRHPWSHNAGRPELIGAADLNGDAYLDNNIVIWRRLRASLFRLTGPWPRLELVGLKAPSDSPLNLARFDDRNWMTTDKRIWFIAEHLCDIPHISLLTQAM
jgi:hypothetical protein